ncbi:MAG TPA: isopentenyl-diphosphate Delta-isomerase [Marmoricola sp.]|nr:isopentenyl-diphosphate Delta-isomerase [Marmoricola sp.]
MTGQPQEVVILVDDAGNALGTTPKATVHHASTPLHLAFSCYVFDPDQRLLVTRRALHKPTWPGVWTNSVCGHPAPGERLADAVRRRAGQELGMELDHLQLTLPAFRYEATMANGVRENELCPVFTAVSSSPARPEPAEVADSVWVPWRSFRDSVLAGERDVSPWCVDQVVQLAALERPEGGFEAAGDELLPPAAKVP